MLYDKGVFALEIYRYKTAEETNEMFRTGEETWQAKI